MSRDKLQWYGRYIPNSFIECNVIGGTLHVRLCVCAFVQQSVESEIVSVHKVKHEHILWTDICLKNNQFEVDSVSFCSLSMGWSSTIVSAGKAFSASW